MTVRHFGLCTNPKSPKNLNRLSVWFFPLLKLYARTSNRRKQRWIEELVGRYSCVGKPLSGTVVLCSGCQPSWNGIGIASSCLKLLSFAILAMKSGYYNNLIAHETNFRGMFI